MFLIGLIFAGLLIYLGLVAVARPDYDRQEVAHKNWMQIPTLEEYWERHPHCRSQSGTSCHHCGSRQFRAWGFEAPNDEKRVLICRQCDLRLYRIGNPAPPPPAWPV